MELWMLQSAIDFTQSAGILLLAIGLISYRRK